MSGALRIVFESAEYRVSTAGSVADATALLEADPAALVLLDLTLPDGDGLAVARIARRAGARAVVAITGHDDRATRRRCLDEGCADVLLKPVAVRELLARARGWLGDGA